MSRINHRLTCVNIKGAVLRAAARAEVQARSNMAWGNTVKKHISHKQFQTHLQRKDEGANLDIGLLYQACQPS